jgi:DNA-binding NarL/FixJ family response regulator
LLDDEIQSIERLERMLSGFPELKILACEHLPEIAVGTIVMNRPDIVFLDVEMPGKSGFEVVEEVRSRNCRPIFIFVTAYNHYAIKAIKDAVFDYLLKPVDIDDLKNVIERYKQKHPDLFTSNEKIQQLSSKSILSDREKEILKLLMQGKTSKEIAKELFISKTTVDTHRKNILNKTGTKTTSELISTALEKCWI